MLYIFVQPVVLSITGQQENHVVLQCKCFCTTWLSQLSGWREFGKGIIANSKSGGKQCLKRGKTAKRINKVTAEKWKIFHVWSSKELWEDALSQIIFFRVTCFVQVYGFRFVLWFVMDHVTGRLIKVVIYFLFFNFRFVICWGLLNTWKYILQCSGGIMASLPA